MRVLPNPAVAILRWTILPSQLLSAAVRRDAQRFGVNRRGIAPPNFAEPERVDARTVQRSF